MKRQQEPRLLTSPLTKTTYIVTDYVEDDLHGDVYTANTKYPVRPRDLLDAVFMLGISESAMDEVAEKLGFSRVKGGERA